MFSVPQLFQITNVTNIMFCRHAASGNTTVETTSAVLFKLTASVVPVCHTQTWHWLRQTNCIPFRSMLSCVCCSIWVIVRTKWITWVWQIAIGMDVDAMCHWCIFFCHIKSIQMDVEINWTISLIYQIFCQIYMNWKQMTMNNNTIY